MEAGRDPVTAERLQKVLAHAGLGSRRQIEDLIRQRRITVNDEIAVLGRRVDVSNDEVKLDGSRVPLAVDLVYLMLNKPVGVVSTARDPQGRPTVIDLIGETMETWLPPTPGRAMVIGAPPEAGSTDPGGVIEASPRLWPVGRLDIDTEGLLIVTNDGDLTFRLTHPRYQVPRVYVAEVGGKVGAGALRSLARGVELEDGLTAPARARKLERGAGSSLLEVTVFEGRKRQVRRMLEAVGHPVRRLVRVGMGPLRLGRLKPGTSRRLAPQEVQAVFSACGP